MPTRRPTRPDALFVRALAKSGVGDVARMNVGQLADLRRKEGAPLALLRRRVAGVPHEVVRDEQPAILKRVQQRHGPMLANERCRTIHLGHGEPSAGGCDRIAFSCMGLLSNPPYV